MAFTFVSGNLALDLAGTLQNRRSARVELLGTPADLAAWTVAAGLLDAPPPVTAARLTAAVALREAIYRLAAGGDAVGAADLELVNAAAARPPVQVKLGADGSIHREGDITAALSSVARSAVELLGGGQVVRECGDAECTRLYLDTSRHGTRRWCDMGACGNRAKVTAFRSRHGRVGLTPAD